MSLSYQLSWGHAESLPEIQAEYAVVLGGVYPFPILLGSHAHECLSVIGQHSEVFPDFGEEISAGNGQGDTYMGLIGFSVFFWPLSPV